MVIDPSYALWPARLIDRQPVDGPVDVVRGPQVWVLENEGATGGAPRVDPCGDAVRRWIDSINRDRLDRADNPYRTASDGDSSRGTRDGDISQERTTGSVDAHQVAWPNLWS